MPYRIDNTVLSLVAQRYFEEYQQLELRVSPISEATPEPKKNVSKQELDAILYFKSLWSEREKKELETKKDVHKRDTNEKKRSHWIALAAGDALVSEDRHDFQMELKWLQRGLRPRGEFERNHLAGHHRTQDAVFGLRYGLEAMAQRFDKMGADHCS
ncbi:hypothetical protein ACQZV8_01850 [Magnetococcales bacterium HHB-1]